MAQRKTLAKSKDSLAKDFEKFRKENEAQKVEFQ
jgi:hypothetical protein